MVGFIHHATDGVVLCALAALHPDHWEKIDQSQSFHGAIWIAARCQELGFQEHNSALITILLHRCNPKDFAPQGLGFANAAWLLTQSSQVDHGPILDVFCTKKWLGWQFTKAACGPLAAGLRMLAMHQPPDVVKRFLNVGLGIRLQREFALFAQATPEQQSQVVQLLGCATLCGWRIRADMFTNESLHLLGYPLMYCRIVQRLQEQRNGSFSSGSAFTRWL